MQLIDPCGRIVTIHHPAQRVISLVPSLTETLYGLGAGQQVVGVSNFCTHPPESVKNVPKVGGQKNPDFSKITELQPDLLLLNREENRKEDCERLSAHFPVYVSDVRRVTDVPEMIRDIGRLTDRGSAAEVLAGKIEQAVIHTALDHIPKHCIRVVTLIWHSPLMTANGDTYLSDWLRRAGAANVFQDAAERYPKVTIEQIVEMRPEVIFFPSEPHQWTDEEIKSTMKKIETSGWTAEPVVIDGAAITWYGTRTLTSLQNDLPNLIRRMNTMAADNE